MPLELVLPEARRQAFSLPFPLSRSHLCSVVCSLFPPPSWHTPSAPTSSSYFLLCACCCSSFNSQGLGLGSHDELGSAPHSQHQRNRDSGKGRKKVVLCGPKSVMEVGFNMMFGFNRRQQLCIRVVMGWYCPV